MESGRRRNTTTMRAKTAMVSVTAARSVGEKKMKNDRVKGGINGDEINSSPDDGQVPRLKPRNAAAAAAGKRKAVKNTVAENKSRSLAHKTCIDAADSCCDCNDNDNEDDDGNVKGDDGVSSSSSSADQSSSNTTRGGSPRPVGLKKTRSDSLTCGSTVSSKCNQLRKLKSEPNPGASLMVSDPSTVNNQTGDLTITNYGSSNSSSTTATAAVLSESCKMLEFNPLGMRVTLLNKLNDHEHPIDPTAHRPVEVEKKQTQEEEEAPATTYEEQVDVCKEIGVCHDKGELITTDHVHAHAHAQGKDEEINIDVAETEIKRPVVTQTSSSSPLHKSLRKGSSIASNATGSRKRMPSLNKPTLNSLSSSPPPQAQGKVSNEDCTRPEIGTHSRLQSVVDLVMWRDVSRSAFVFGIGTFLIISSSFAKDLDISLITVVSYSSLVYLAIVFLYRSFPCRGIIEDQVHPHINVFGEEEAVWLVKLILPYLNEFLVKVRELFSGDPGVTMKLALMLFVLAKWGSSITIWKMTKLGFFGAFLIPKLCSSYSTQITAYGKFWVRRFQDAWHSCSQKKAVAIAICTLVWNFSSVVARVWAAFMLYVAFRYYQQYLATNDWVEDQSGLHDLQQKYTTSQRHKILSEAFEKKEKKSL